MIYDEIITISVFHLLNIQSNPKYSIEMFKKNRKFKPEFFFTLIASKILNF